MNIRGKNIEATSSILFFGLTFTIVFLSLLFSRVKNLLIPIEFFSNNYFIALGVLLLFFNLIVASLALIQMKDSWRVGIKESDKTVLIKEGIFGYSRNPYFLSYILLFIAYTILIANVAVLISSLISVFFIHKMILKEEEYLEKIHRENYINYKKRVPRYFIF